MGTRMPRTHTGRGGCPCILLCLLSDRCLEGNSILGEGKRGKALVDLMRTAQIPFSESLFSATGSAVSRQPAGL